MNGDVSDATAGLSRDILLDLISQGILAPSPDNYQPWKFRLTQAGLELWIDRTKAGYFFDPLYAATLISCGGVLENIAIAAKAQGLMPHIDRTAVPETPDRVATVTVSPDNPQIDPLYPALSARHTHRGLYRRYQSIPQASRAKLSAIVQTTPGYALHWFTAPEQRREVIRILTASDLLRFSHETIHKEFHESLRFGQEADRLRDGLAADTLGIEKILLPILKSLRPWKLTATLNRFGLHYVMAIRGSWLPLVSAPLIGALLQSGEQDYVEAGRQRQRLWLQAQALGLNFQPFCALPLFLVRLHELDGEGFSASQKDQLHTLEKRLQALIPTCDWATNRPIMFFRLGHAKAPAVRARRKPVESFLLQDVP